LDPIFYVNEKESDEFTFYLDRGKDNKVISKLRAQLGYPEDAEATGSATTKMFSLPQRILVKNLILTKDALKLPSHFWTGVRKAAKSTPRGYLCERLNKNHYSRKCLSKKKLNEADKKILFDATLRILNNAVQKDRLEKHQWRIGAFDDRDKEFLDSLTASEANKWRNRFIMEHAFRNVIKGTQAGRALICYSYVSQYLSVTFRKISDDQGYKAGHYVDEAKRKNNLFSLGEYCDLLYREVFQATNSAQHAQGLVVITGSTKSAKSEIARGLIQLYLDGKGKSDRRHHLVTFEDPVERFYAYKNIKGCSPWGALDLPMKSVSRDYTPRQKESDARLLQDALNDALRQTPALFFVGETRNSREWKVLLNFAATGHLIVTTAHAGSLVEAMHKIFEALEVKTAADRSEVASKLLGVIHLRRDALMFSGVAKKKRNGPSILFPALWRRTPRGIAALTSDGLASLLPYRPPNNVSDGDNQPAVSHESDKDPTERAASCLGRRWIIEQLMTKTITSQQITKAYEEKLVQKLLAQVYEQATEWDLQGV
jgi:hypothetical protein